MVEAQKSLPRTRRSNFVFAKTHGGSSLLHPGFPKERSVFEGDLTALQEFGLLRLSFGSAGTPLYDVTQRGYTYYENFKRTQGQPVERVEKAIRQWLDSERFQSQYPTAYAKWADAEQMLWASDSQEQLSKIGHVCRESIIAFTDTLANRFNPPDIDPDSAHTVRRLTAILEHRADQLGSTERPFLRALIAYWSTLSDLVQRQEHAALREKEELVWEDGRRVVFHTALSMYEIDRALFS